MATPPELNHTRYIVIPSVLSSKFSLQNTSASEKHFFLQPLSFTIIFKLSMPGPPGAIRATESYLEAERNIIHLISL